MKKNLNIQGLRAIFALIVFLGHSYGTLEAKWFDIEPFRPLRLFLDGSISVVFFFVLSGYFYYNTKEYNLKYHLQLIKKRMLRIAPPYWIILTVGALIYYIYQRNGICHSDAATPFFSKFWSSDITFSRYIHDFLILYRGYPSAEFIIPASWYLEVDIKMMIAIPFVIFFLNKYGWRWCWILTVPVLLNSPVFQSSFQVAISFLMGAGVHCLQKSTSTFNNINGYACVVIIILSLLLLDIKYMPFVEISSSGEPDYWITICLSLGAAMLIWAFTTIKDISLLSNKYIVGLGNISYEFYISHMVILLALEPFFANPYIFTAIAFILSVLVSVALKKINSYIETAKLAIK